MKKKDNPFFPKAQALQIIKNFQRTLMDNSMFFKDDGEEIEDANIVDGDTLEITFDDPDLDFVFPISNIIMIDEFRNGSFEFHVLVEDETVSLMFEVA